MNRRNGGGKLVRYFYMTILLPNNRHKINIIKVEMLFLVEVIYGGGFESAHAIGIHTKTNFNNFLRNLIDLLKKN